MRLFRPCFFADWLYPEAFFSLETTSKLLCLTFDDGPNPDSTHQLLDILDLYDIKALFFCDGRAAGKHPELIKQVIEKGHQIGNHGFNHLNGWTTSLKRYLADVSDAAPYTSFTLFRPPYGRLRINQYRELKKKYKIIFWDIMPYDFDETLGSVKSLQILKIKIRPGSIIVLHDTPNSAAIAILREFIDYAISEGYRFGIPF